jgi:rhamnose utilization protein RhaD (predicted bifunctional aldolase and dehydrogenase)
MSSWKWGLVAMVLFVGQAASRADDIDEDKALTAEQKKQLKKVQSSLGAAKDTKQTKEQKQAAVSGALRGVLIQDSQPSEQSIDDLASTMSSQIAGGGLSVPDSLLVTKKLMLFLNQGDFSIDSNRALVKEVSGLIQASNLTADERNQFYNSILTVVSTADGNKRKAGR